MAQGQLPEEALFIPSCESRQGLGGIVGKEESLVSEDSGLASALLLTPREAPEASPAQALTASCPSLMPVIQSNHGDPTPSGGCIATQPGAGGAIWFQTTEPSESMTRLAERN